MTPRQAEELRDWLAGGPTRATELLHAVRKRYAIAMREHNKQKLHRAWRVWRDIANTLASHGLHHEPPPDLPEWAAGNGGDHGKRE